MKFLNISFKKFQKSAENLSQKEFPVLVYNLPPVSENHLQQKFQGVGRILRCVLCVDIRQQFSGDAYIWFGSREEAEKVVLKENLNNLILGMSILQ